MTYRHPHILVCGGRDFSDRRLLYRTLDRICEARGWMSQPDCLGNWLPRVVIIAGAAFGADAIAADWAVVNWCPLKEYPADWKSYGRAAGPIRNKQMLEDGKPDLVVAFPGGAGTADMVRRARSAGVEVIEVGTHGPCETR